jgi:hypothetical protein
MGLKNDFVFSSGVGIEILSIPTNDVEAVLLVFPHKAKTRLKNKLKKIKFSLSILKSSVK